MANIRSGGKLRILGRSRPYALSSQIDQPDGGTKTMLVASRCLPFCLMSLGCIDSIQANARSAYSSEIGLKSQTSIRIEASIAPRMQFRGTQRLQVQRERGTSWIVQPLCVWSNTLSRTYSIRTAGSAENAFSPVGKAGSRLAYKVEWADGPDNSDRVVLSRETPLEGLIAASPTVPCGTVTANRPRLMIRLPESGVSAIQADDYAGILLIIVAPQ